MLIDERVMALSRDDFFRLIPAALDSAKLTIEADTANIYFPQGRIRITLLSAYFRRMGSLSFPALHIRIESEQLNADEVKLFMKRFERAFLRGGG